MNKPVAIILLTSLSALAGGLYAQDSVPAVTLEPPPSESLDHLSASFRMGLNISANFKTTFGQQATIASPGVHGVDRTYDDGYNKVDSTGNAGGYTTFWGYQNSGQYSSGDGTLQMHSASGSAISNGRTDDPQLGAELTYDRQFTRGDDAAIGFELAFNYMSLGISDNRPLAATGSFVSDTYQLPPTEGGGFVIPPPAPYNGPFQQNGANPLLFDTPASRDSSALVASISGSRKLDADVFGWRVGPYLEFTLSDRVSLGFSGGLALALVSGDLTVNQTITYSPNNNGQLVNLTSKSSGSHDQVLVGGFVACTINVAISKRWGAFCGAQYQDLGHYGVSAGNTSARLDLSDAVFVTVGGRFSF